LIAKLDDPLAEHQMAAAPAALLPGLAVPHRGGEDVARVNDVVVGEVLLGVEERPTPVGFVYSGWFAR
jgi:hypothetical protein